MFVAEGFNTQTNEFADIIRQNVKVPTAFGGASHTRPLIAIPCPR